MHDIEMDQACDECTLLAERHGAGPTIRHCRRTPAAAPAGVGAGRASARASAQRGATSRPYRGASQRMMSHIEANAAHPSSRSRMPQTAEGLAAAQSGSTMPIKPIAYDRAKSAVNTTERNR